MTFEVDVRLLIAISAIVIASIGFWLGFEYGVSYRANKEWEDEYGEPW